MNQIFVLAIILALTNAAPKAQSSQNPRLFDTPHVFLTLSSEAGLGSGTYEDTLFELNWYGFTAGDGWDRVSLYDGNPIVNSSLIARASILINSTSAAKGYFKTDIRFGHPEITSEDEPETDNCLGYWITFHRNSTLLASNCFRKYPRWMNNLREVIGNRPLSLLMIPGTHDAGAIRVYDGVGAENPIVRYSVTQEEQLYRQFVHGIRYVDIRVSHYPGTDEKWWINHGDIRFQPLHTLFTAVRRFVEETGEIIFMDFHGFPVGFDDISTHDALLTFVQEQIGDLLLSEDMVPANPTPNQVWATEKTVILTYQVDSISSQHSFLWPYLIHAWGDKNRVDPLEEYFAEEALPRYGCSGVWWSAMAEMTPTPADVILLPLQGLRGFAQFVNIPLSYWWMREDWYSRSMIVSTDFFLGNNIIEMAVAVNTESAVCPNYPQK